MPIELGPGRQAGRKYETAPNAPAKGFIIIIELRVIWCAPVLVSGLLLLLSKGHQTAKTAWIILWLSVSGRHAVPVVALSYRLHVYYSQSVKAQKSVRRRKSALAQWLFD